jgi:phosphodiesterase/alkaline phosphatase D-like protein
MARLIVGPLLRYVSETAATIWVETDRACEVSVLGHSQRTFTVEGHHYALVQLTGLRPGQAYEYEVLLDGERAWPEPGGERQPCSIRTPLPESRLRVAFGSCRQSLPHTPPYTNPKEDHDHARGPDALYGYWDRISRQPGDHRPDLLLLLGDQVYADETSP